MIAAVALVGLGVGLYLGSHSQTEDSGTALHVNPSPATTETRTASSRPATVETQATVPEPKQANLLADADRASFQTLESTIGGSIGLAISRLGFGQPVSELGTLRDGVAWSTIKVPIALAVEARSDGHPAAHEQTLLAEALTASDNAAAEALWASLGQPDAAAAAVQTVLAATGDSSTRVETEVLRPGFTSFGQTKWSLAAQAQFIAALPCLPHSRPVRSLMREVVVDQRWGLGTLAADSEFKGGWGPDPDGGYFVRQMGIISLPNGHSLAVSMATMPAEGTFEAGTANLNQIARWVIANVDESGAGATSCRA